MLKLLYTKQGRAISSQIRFEFQNNKIFLDTYIGGT